MDIVQDTKQNLYGLDREDLTQCVKINVRLGILRSVTFKLYINKQF